MSELNDKFENFKPKDSQLPVYESAKESLVRLCKKRFTGTSSLSDEDKKSPYLYHRDNMPQGVWEEEREMDHQVRCQLIAPCGSGKTTMSAHLAILTEARTIIFVCPLITLVNQTAQEYVKIFDDYSSNGGKKATIKTCCSSKKINENIKRCSPQEAVEWVSVPEPNTVKVLVTTYATVSKDNGIFSKFETQKGCVDFLVLDEAHYLVGPTETKKIRACHFLPARAKISVTATPKIHPGNQHKPGEDFTKKNLNGFWGYEATISKSSQEGSRKGNKRHESEEDMDGEMIEEVDPTNDISEEENGSKDKLKIPQYDRKTFACQNDMQGIFGPVMHSLSLGEAVQKGLVLDCATVTLLPKDTENVMSHPEHGNDLDDSFSKLASLDSTLQCSSTNRKCEFCKKRRTDRKNEHKERQNQGGFVEERKQLLTRTMVMFVHILYHIAKRNIHKVVAYAKDTSRAKLVAEICHCLSRAVYENLENVCSTKREERIRAIFPGISDNDYKYLAENFESMKKNIEAFSENCDVVASTWEYTDVPKKLENFKSARCGFLANCQIMKVGQNITSIDAIVLLDKVSTLGDFIQIIGRGMRTVSDSDKKSYEQQHSIDMPDKKFCRLFLATCMEAEDVIKSESNQKERENAEKGFVECLQSLYKADTIADKKGNFEKILDMYRLIFEKDEKKTADIFKVRKKPTEADGVNGREAADSAQGSSELEIPNIQLSEYFDFLKRIHFHEGAQRLINEIKRYEHNKSEKSALDIIKGYDQNSVNCMGEDGRTPLLTAIVQGKEEFIHPLIQEGADINSSGMGKKAPYPPLLLVAAKDLRYPDGERDDLVSQLLKNKADVNARSSGTRATALMIASVQGHVEMVKRLIEAKADKTLQDKNKLTAADLVNIRLSQTSQELPIHTRLQNVLKILQG